MYVRIKHFVSQIQPITYVYNPLCDLQNFAHILGSANRIQEKFS